MTIRSSPVDTISDADLIVAVPPSGPLYARWEERVFQTRLASLGQVAELCQQTLPVDEFASFSALTQKRLLLTPEAGRWLCVMRKWLAGCIPDRGERYGDLPRQFNLLLLGSYLREPPQRPVRVGVPTTEGCLVPLISDNAFLKLSMPHGIRPGHVECVVDRSQLAVRIDGVRIDRWSMSEVREAVRDEGRTAFAMADLPNGIHRLPRLPNLSTVVGLPIGGHYTPCLHRMSENAEGKTDVEFPRDVSTITHDIALEVERLSETWAEMISALDGHAKVVVPVMSNTVLSYSESSTPNVLFVRARPLNPLWYTELLLHECAHTWLASLMEVWELLSNSRSAGYSSPWRVDRRPLIGVLFATHAFALVTALLAKQLGRGLVDDDVLGRRIVFEAERVNRGYEVLRKHGEFTTAGRMLVASLAVHVGEASRVSNDCRGAYRQCLAAPVDKIWPTVIRSV